MKLKILVVIKQKIFVTKYDNALILDRNKEYVVGLNRIINMSFTWFNVKSGLNNQLIRFSSDSGKLFTDIKFPEGTWGYDDFNEYIHGKITSYKDSDGNVNYPINLTFNEATFRVTITLDANYQLDLTKSNFNELIGYDKKIIKDETNVASRVPNLSQDTDFLNIHCDLVNSSLVDGK